MAGKKLLVADDSLTIQKVIRLALSNEGYDIQTVSDGEDAVQQIAVIRPDAVLIDVSLPGRTAFEVKRAIQGQDDLKNVKFILMSSAFERIDEDQERELQFDGRLTKPFDPAHLRQVLINALSGQSGLSPARDIPPPPLDLPSPGRPTFAPPMPSSVGRRSIPALPPLPEHEELPPFESMPPPPAGAPFPPGSPDSEDDWMPPPPESDPFAGAAKNPSLSANPGDPLWDSEPTMEWKPDGVPGLTPRDPEPETAAAPPASAAPGETEEDIKHLTESTIRMSGLDDFEWSVKEPSLKPPTALADDGSTTFRFDGDDDFTPPPPAPEPTPAPAPTRSSRASTDPFPAAAPATRASSVSDGDLDARIKAQVDRAVRETLERVAQKVLPEIAERVIKQEIHRLLSEI